MDTKDLRCFCRVYEERGINQAAKQLFISPQGLSRIIAKLEAELQVALFKRSARDCVRLQADRICMKTVRNC